MTTGKERTRIERVVEAVRVRFAEHKAHAADETYNSDETFRQEVDEGVDSLRKRLEDHSQSVARDD
jgi:hypothetical protein